MNPSPEGYKLYTYIVITKIPVIKGGMTNVQYTVVYIYIFKYVYIYKESIDPGVWLIIKPIIDVFGGNEDLNHAGVGEKMGDSCCSQSPNIYTRKIQECPRRWAPISYKWSYNPYKLPYKWVTGVITPISGVITLLIAGRGPTL